MTRAYVTVDSTDYVLPELVVDATFRARIPLSLVDDGGAPEGGGAIAHTLLQDFIDECISSGREGFIPPGNWTVTGGGVEISDTCTIKGARYGSVLNFSGAITDAITITAAAYVRLERFRVGGDASGTVNAIVSAYDGGSTAFRHEFIDLNVSSFTGRGFSSHNNEHSVWQRCYAFACGTGFFHDATLGVMGPNIQNRWIQCRAHSCTGNGFELQSQYDFTLDVESLDNDGANAQVWIKSVTANGNISVDVERPSDTPASTGVGLLLSGDRHNVRAANAYNLLTAVSVSSATNCEIHSVRKSATTNGIVFANEANSNHIVFDRTIDITDFVGTGNVRIGTTAGDSIVGSSTTTATIGSESFHKANATSAAYTVTLPTAVGISGRTVTIKKIDSSANAVTIEGAGSEAIDGFLNKALRQQYDSITLTSDGTGWQVTKPGLPTPISNQTATTYTFFGSDAGRLVTFNNAAAITATVPTIATTGSIYRVGDRIEIVQLGAGQVTIAAAGGVTVNGTPGLKLRAQHSKATLIMYASDVWNLSGDIAA